MRRLIIATRPILRFIESTFKMNCSITNSNANALVGDVCRRLFAALESQTISAHKDLMDCLSENEIDVAQMEQRLLETTSTNLDEIIAGTRDSFSNLELVAISLHGSRQS